MTGFQFFDVNLNSPVVPLLKGNIDTKTSKLTLLRCANDLNSATIIAWVNFQPGSTESRQSLLGRTVPAQKISYFARFKAHHFT